MAPLQAVIRAQLCYSYKATLRSFQVTAQLAITIISFIPHSSEVGME